MSVDADWAPSRLDPDLAAFLESQPKVRDLSLRGIPAYTSNPFTLPPSALPHLESIPLIHVDPDTLGEVTATRPVQGISLSLFLEHRSSPNPTPVRRLTILSSTRRRRARPAAPRGAPRRPRAEDTLLASAPLLEAFAGLRFLTFMASGASRYELDDEAKVADTGPARATLNDGHLHTSGPRRCGTQLSLKIMCRTPSLASVSSQKDEY
ncbi:hypothetical protein BC826DRAFT_1104660 [Russula brevipes]|nr:hypothetical protein BC826DRAFT_1104660 [Russula brevipes]